MSFARLIYTLLLYAAVPFILLRLLWRARLQRDYLRHVPERFGFFRVARSTKPLLWVHAVSVGETRAAEPLIRALRSCYPQHDILLTHMTPTGRETGVALFGDDVLHGYLPYDLPDAAARFLQHFRPVAGMLLETEIWPNLIHNAAARGIPLYLVNARLSERSLRGYQRVSGLIGDALRALHGIAAQTQGDAGRLQALGAAAVYGANGGFGAVGPIGGGGNAGGTYGPNPAGYGPWQSGRSRSATVNYNGPVYVNERADIERLARENVRRMDLALSAGPV